MLLNNKRKEIDKIDEELLNLFQERLVIVEEIKKYKVKNNLAIYDKAREDEILKKIQSKYKDSNYFLQIETFIKTVIAISRDYQNEK